MPGGCTLANHGVGDSYGPNDRGCCSDDLASCQDRPDIGMGCWAGGYGQATVRSSHTGSSPIAMGDATVRMVTDGTTQQIFYYMNSRNDGNTFEANW